MKANEAPEKIHIPVKHYAALYAFAKKEKDSDIEYIRKDIFIEKACSWLKNHYRDYMHNPTGKRLEAFFGGDMYNDFEDYMKGE